MIIQQYIEIEDEIKSILLEALEAAGLARPGHVISALMIDEHQVNFTYSHYKCAYGQFSTKEFSGKVFDVNAKYFEGERGEAVNLIAKILPSKHVSYPCVEQITIPYQTITWKNTIE